MSEKLTVTQALQNPAGLGSANVANRYAILENMNYRSQKLFSSNKMNFKVYRDGSNYIIHFNLPSEQEEYKLTYDVVFRLIPQTSAEQQSRVISSYELEFFSNSPAFMFTYAYALDKKQWLIKELRNKFSKNTLDNEPTERNPSEGFGFEKSIYFCLLYMRNNQLTFKSTLDRFVEGNVNWKKLDDLIITPERKLLQYNAEKKKYKEAQAIIKKKEAKAKAAEKAKATPNKNQSRTSSTIKNISNIKNTPTSKSSKRAVIKTKKTV